MNSRPAPGIQESLQRGGSGGPQRPQVRRQPSTQVNNSTNAQHRNIIDLTLDVENRATDEAQLKSNDSAPVQSQGPAKAKPGPLHNIQTGSIEQGKPSSRGKPQLFFSSGISTAAESPAASAHGQHGGHQVNAGTALPMPPRPGSASYEDMMHSRRRAIPNGSKLKQEVATKFDGFDPSPQAMLFPGSKPTDFFPWHGNHQEDVLSETLVKAGISNKPQIMNENNTARPSLWSNLKNKSGLQNLSALFVSVLEKRQSSGRFQGKSSFKAPPRIVLSADRRDNWLTELANPAVALRKLSKTIPHGIKGKFLLEQCLNKNIPVPRAVWFANCVGYNELNSFKRRGGPGSVGIGSEVLFIRDWTITVEQFVESTVATIGQPHWKQKITYALRLATELYNENLLDQDHYLDWLLTSLHGSSQERLFFWLLLVPLHWKDLIAFRRRGKRLAESLLSQAQKLHTAGDDVTQSPLSDLLDTNILNLLMASTACLLLPKAWPTYRETLLRIVDKQANLELNKTVADLDRRNKLLLSPSKQQPASSKTPAKEMVTLLDSACHSTHISIDQISRSCLQLIPNTDLMLTTVLQWASSIFRVGIHRIYLAVRLLRKWNRSGLDTDDAIISFLHSIRSTQSFEPLNVIRIIAELVRSKSFSVGKYLQWLIATGSLAQGENPSQAKDWHVRLITELPLSGLSDQVTNLRNTLLRGIGYPIELEDQMLDRAQDYIEQKIPNLFEPEMVVDEPEQVDIASLSITVRLELGFWIRHQVAENVEIIECLPKPDTAEDCLTLSTINSSDFCAVRDLLERLGDFSVLADVLGIVSSSLDAAVLTAAADTLHYHEKVLAAVGAFNPLFENIRSKYALFRTTRVPERELLVALSDLARTANAEPQFLQVLAYDSSKLEQRNSVAACSPASDSMLETNMRADADEEIDRILSSGTSMDQQMMNRVFIKITTKMEEHLAKNVNQTSSCVQWFHRLRNFDEKAFEKLMNQWLSSLLAYHQRKLILVALPTLIAAGCITLSSFMDLARICMAKLASKSEDNAGRVAIEALDALLPSDELNALCHPQDAYRYRLEQQKFSRDPQKRILQFLREALNLCSVRSSAEFQTHVSSLLSSQRLRNVVKQFAVADLQGSAEILEIGSHCASDSTRSGVKSMLDGLLDPAGTLNLTPKKLEEQVTTVIDIVDDLSLPFCQLELRQIFAMNSASTEEPDDKVSGVLLEAIKTAVDNDRSNWSDLVAGLDSKLTCKIREYAEREILDASTCLSSPNSAPGSPDEAFLRRYLAVIDCTSSCTCRGQTQTINGLAERLRAVTELLTAAQDKQLDDDNIEVATSTTDLCVWIDTLLHLALLYVTSPQANNKSSQGHQGQNSATSNLLWILRALFTHPVLASHPSTTEHVFDIAVVFSDHLSDDARTQLAKADAARSLQDPRCAFICGSRKSPNSWLGLMSPSSNPPSQVTSAPSSQQQSFQNQSSQSPGPMPMQRSNSQQQLQLQQMQTGRFQQYAQQKQMTPQLQRFASQHGGQTPQQYMQSLAQQRSMSNSPSQGQSPSQAPSYAQPQSPALGQQSSQSQGPPQSPGIMGRGAAGRMERPEIRPVPFNIKRWELLPDANPALNEPSLNLGLFGARRV